MTIKILMTLKRTTTFITKTGVLLAFCATFKRRRAREGMSRHEVLPEKCLFACAKCIPVNVNADAMTFKKGMKSSLLT